MKPTIAFVHSNNTDVGGSDIAMCRLVVAAKKLSLIHISVPALLRLPGRFVPRIAGRSASRASRLWRRAAFNHRRDRWRLVVSLGKPEPLIADVCTMLHSHDPVFYV